ncbi:Alkaline phosphatase synthesis transcriptional regulatory protein PhoP [Methanosarcinales archaeon]|nr:Alkaline phosphatase synthesis transcriptional regulatory protein PhoP [Methanosarcinales archaeon]
MTKNIDDKIVELIRNNENISSSDISRILGIPEREVERRIRGFSDVRQKIMIVDDEMATLLPLKRSLEAEGYIVIEAVNGYEAIEKSKTELPELIVLDLMLPGIDGFDVCTQLKNDTLTEKIPVIMLTAKDEMRDKVEGLELGADDYVTKPFNLNELKARIRNILKRSREI